jgi:DNA/RNA endonuclease G (NUC1)
MTFRVFRALVVCAALFAFILHRGDSVRALSSDLVISQIYGGGGNAGATYTNDFIEIFNRGTSSVSLSGKSVQYASSAGTTWQVTSLTNVTLAPGQYYLVQEAVGAGGTTSLPAPDATGSIPMSATAGKVALVAGTMPLSGSCPTMGVIDFVGFGGANCAENAATPGLSNTTAALRANAGCTETDNNAGDFATGAPSPRNSASSPAPCGGGDAPPTVTGTTPANSATNVPVNANIIVNFSETVTAGAGAFALACNGVAQDLTPTASPNSTFTLDPVSDLPNGETCTLTVTGSSVTDTDGTPDPMAANHIVSFTTVGAPTSSTSVIVISQVYGGGGNSGATFRNDYVELYNRGTATVDVTGWSVQYASAAGTDWSNKQMLTGTIAPGQYYLISLASGGTAGAFLPEPNSDGGINMSASAGKVALVDNGDNLSGACPFPNTRVMDFVGYGTSASCREGATNAPGGNNTTAVLRKDGGATDTDTNGADFEAGTPLPRRTAPFVEVGPTVVFTDPGTNGLNAPRDATIEISFSEPVDVSGTWFDISCAVSGAHHSATFATTTLTRYITPNDNFTPGEQCTVTIFKDQVTDQDLDDAGANTNTLPANHVWSFTVANGAPPAFPPSVHLAMGKPSEAIASLDSPADFLMEKPEYALSYNRDLGRPNWVSWHLSQEWIGTLQRVDTFRPDPGVPPEWYRVQSFDFSGSGFDRGHMVPNADSDPETSIPINQATFLMSNMLAQAPDNNQGPWAALENDLRALLPANELYIAAGGIGTGGTGSTGVFTTTLAGGKVTVPAATWKVALVIPAGGGDDISRVSCGSRTIAVLMPNSNGPGFRNQPWQDFLTTVDAIEALTGYDVFSNLPAAVQRCVEAGINGVNPRNEPVFSALASPTIEAGTATVAISGMLTVAGLAPPGTVAVSLAGVTVTAPIAADGGFTAILPTNTLSTANSPYAIGFGYAGDANFTGATGSSSLTVIDTTEPTIGGVTTTPNELGAPNHKMVDVRVEYSVTDFSGAPSCTLSVASNEPINGIGDGHTSEDWRVVDAHHVQLRAERAGGGGGRVYSITIRCADASGNASTGVGTVRVPK